MRLGVVADPHLSVQRDEPASWHNPYRLHDAHERLDRALHHPLLDDVDAIALLGDIAHFGDRASLRAAVDIIAAASGARPVIVLSGNHDVLEAGVRLEDEVAAVGDLNVVSPCAWPDSSPVIKPFEAEGFGLHVHEVMAVTDRATEPFDVRGWTKVAGVRGDLLLSHFPVLSFERRAREASLLYSGHLSQLAPVRDLTVPNSPICPVVAMSGHLHLRGVAADGAVLQFAFAALVEAPYELARVELDWDRDDLVIRYRCESAHPPDMATLPVLDPPLGTWRWCSQRGWSNTG
jgi:Calcineurin-like phosphoesterase